MYILTGKIKMPQLLLKMLFFNILCAVTIKTTLAECIPAYITTCSNFTFSESWDLEINTEAEHLTIENSKIPRIPAGFFKAKFPNLEILNLDGQGVEDIASEAFTGIKNLSYLNLKENLISELPAKVLSGNLQYVYLSDNKISSLHPEPFSDAVNLEVLDLSSNQISFIAPETFSKLPKLRSLNLNFNSIKTMDKDWFYPFSNISSISITSNGMTSLGPNLFQHTPNLKKIDFNTNNISYIDSDTFAKLDKLRILYLSNNKIDILPKNFLSSCTNLSELDISVNKIKTFDLEISIGGTELVSFNFSTNNISHIKHDPIYCKIADFYLSNNELTDEDANFLISCPETSIVHMNNNKVKNLKLESFLNTSKTSLHFSTNEMEELDFSILSEMNNASIVFLNKNKIKTLRKNYEGKIDLQYLHLEENDIEKIPSNAFRSFKNLKELHLEENKISIVEPGGFSTLESDLIEKVFLQRNNIDVFGNWFVGGSKIKFLGVSYNRIKTVEKQALNGTQNLKELDLSHNNISEILENSFNSKHLKKLYLNHNNLTVLTDNVFVSCPQLTLIDFQFNKISVIEEHAFRNLYRLKFLYLQNNKLEVLTYFTFYDTYSLTFLDVSHNQIEHISTYIFPETRGFHYSSFFLDASFNKLQRIRGEIFQHFSNSTEFHFNFNENPLSCHVIEKFLNHFEADPKVRPRITLDQNSCKIVNVTIKGSLR